MEVHPPRATASPRRRYPPDHWTQQPVTGAMLQEYVAKNGWPYNVVKVALMDRLVSEDLRGKAVLDYGGGGGFMSVRYAARGAHVTLVDAEPGSLALARKLAAERGVSERLAFILGETVPPGATESFDLVLAKDVIEHVPDDEGLLADLARRQPPGGRILLSTQNSWSVNYALEGTYRRWWHGESDWCGWDPTHVRFYTPLALARRLRRAGYRPRRWSGLSIVPYNILSWATLLRRRIHLQFLEKLDLILGPRFPFNRLGWNLIVLAERTTR